MSFSIKQIHEDDWRELQSIRLAALQCDPSCFGSTYAKEVKMTEKDWRDWLASNDMAIFILVAENASIGMTGIVIDKKDATKENAILWGSWIAPEWRGKGLSNLLYSARLDWARKHPTAKKVLVSHRASNITSKHANQKHGFTYTHQYEKTWADGVTEDDVCYELMVK